jgi:nucleoside permease NupC
MSTLVTQSTVAMTRKQFYTTMSGGAITVAAFVVGYAIKMPIPPGVEAAAVLMAGTIIGYYVRDRA